MYRTWTARAEDQESLARSLEVHLNEYAEEIISVTYAVRDAHYVLAVYREIDIELEDQAAVTLAEQIIDEASA